MLAIARITAMIIARTTAKGILRREKSVLSRAFNVPEKLAVSNSP